MNLVFRPADEKLNLTLTLIAVGLISAELFFGLRGTLRPNYSFINLLAGLLFLEAFHVILTFVGILFTPELQRWSAALTGGRPWKFWLPVAARVIFLFSIIFFSSMVTERSTKHSTLLVHLIVVTIVIVTVHHRIFQNQGISLSYSLILGQDSRLRRLEKRAFWLFFSCTAVHYMTYLCRPALHSLFGFSSHLIQVGRTISMALALLFASLLMALAFYQYRQAPEKPAAQYKVVYLFRTFFYPLVSVSYCALIATETLHGFEYVLLWRKLSRGFKEKLSSQKLIISLACALTIAALFYVVTYQKFIWKLVGVEGNSAAKTLWLRLSFSTYLAVTLTHFYIDKVLFRMKNPASRAIIGPMIIAPATGVATNAGAGD